MVEQEHSAGGQAPRSRLRRALPGAGQLLGAAVAATLWLGLASPSLELLPGIDGLADESIEISLQSAILGIDDGSGRPAEERARAAAAVLGLAYDQRLLAVWDGDSAASPTGVSGVVRLRDFAAQLASTPQLVAGEESVAATPIAHAVTPPAAPSAPASPTVPSAAAAPAADAPEPAAALPRPLPSPRPERPTDEPALLRSQLVTFASVPPTDAVVGDTYRAVANASSGLPVKLSIGAGRNACKLSGATVAFRSTGTCVVEAHQGGNDKYAQADARQTFEIGRAGQTIAFTSTPPDPALVGGSYTIAASASSGLPVVFSAEHGGGRACDVAGAAVTFTRAGTCTIEADQGGDGSFLPAARARQSFTVAEPPVALLSQTISFTTSPPSPATAGGTYSVAAIASSGLPVSISVAAGSADVCEISGGVVSLLGAGTCTIAADQTGGAVYAAAPQEQQSFTVVRASQTIAFSSSAPASAVYGGPDYTVAASASSGLAVVFSIAPASAGVCTISGSTVSIVGAGTCTIAADQTGDAVYEPAPQAQQSFTVGKASQTITITSPNPSPVDRHSAPYTITATATSGLPVAFSIDPSSADNCQISGSTITFDHQGDCIVRANQPGNANYLAAPQVQQTIVVVPHV